VLANTRAYIGEALGPTGSSPEKKKRGPRCGRRVVGVGRAKGKGVRGREKGAVSLYGKGRSGEGLKWRLKEAGWSAEQIEKIDLRNSPPVKGARLTKKKEEEGLLFRVMNEREIGRAMGEEATSNRRQAKHYGKKPYRWRAVRVRLGMIKLHKHPAKRAPLQLQKRAPCCFDGFQGGKMPFGQRAEKKRATLKGRKGKKATFRLSSLPVPKKTGGGGRGVEKKSFRYRATMRFDGLERKAYAYAERGEFPSKLQGPNKTGRN